MAYELKQQLKLSQQLIMTPQLQQAIKLLQLSRLELSNLIRQEMNENPVLDEIIDEEEKDGISDGKAQTEVNEIGELSSKGDTNQEFDWKDYFDKMAIPRSTYASSEDREEFETIITKKTSLSEHLLWQLRLSNLTKKQQEIGEYIIGNLDKDGYLQTTVKEIASECQVEEDQVEEVRRKLQMFDPVGVASKNLQECLLAQAEVLSIDNALIKEILFNHMYNLENRRYQVMAKDLNVSLEQIIEASHTISQMEPRPGRPFNDNEPQYITPDIYVYKLGDEYVVALNEDGQPKLRINPFYKKALIDKNMSSEKAKEYIQEKLRSAVWLIKSIYHRQGTIQNVMKSIIRFQMDFFDKGVGHLKPLVLRDVAEDIGMHESNISRVTTNKYVYTPHGIFELKYFFNSGLSSDNGESIASESVKDKIKDILQKEDPHKPYSDQDIANVLKEQGINIARRTVTKYRETLGVLSSSKRKKHI